MKMFTAVVCDVEYDDRVFARCTRREDAFLIAAVLNDREAKPVAKPVKKKIARPVKKKRVGRGRGK